jgi:hypothetical protein
MKKVLMGMALLLGLSTAQAQENSRDYEGDKSKVVTKEVSVDNFTAINLSGVMNVYLTQGDKISVKVEAAEKMQDKIEVNTEGNTLYVKTKKGNWSNVKKMNVYITFTNLSEIHNKLVGNLKSETTIKETALRYKSAAVGNTNLQLDVNDLKIDIAAVGNTELTGKALNCQLNNSSVGNVRAGSLMVENMDLTSSAIGNLEYHAKNTVAVKSTGIGKVTNKQKKEESR